MPNSSIETKKSATPDQFLASTTINEDSKIKHLQRVVLNDDLGVGLSGAPATGVAPEAGASGLLGWLSSIYKKLAGVLTISAETLPLPTGAATDEAVTGLSAKLPVSLGAKIKAESLSVALATDTPSIPVSGEFFPPVQPVNGTVTANIENAGNIATEVTLSALNSKTPALGQALAAASVPVVLTAAQIASLTPPAAITGFATEATLATLSAKLPASLGAKTSAASLSITPATDSLFPVNLSQIGGVAADSTGLAIKRSQDYAAVNRYFSAPVNPTIGTPVAINAAAQNAFVSTAPSITINATTKAVNLDRIVLQIGGIGATITALQIAVTIDTTNRFTSGGTTLAGRSTLNQSAPTAVVRVAGVSPIVATASGATDHRFYRGVIKSAAPVANDVYNLVFGNDNTVEPNASNSTLMTKAMPPLIIPAGGTALIYLYGTGQTAAPTFEGMVYFEE